jgi:hypothetical protein
LLCEEVDGAGRKPNPNPHPSPPGPASSAPIEAVISAVGKVNAKTIVAAVVPGR